MTFHVIIPARFASTRLPGKPLIDLRGKPMIQRVYDQAMQSDAKSVCVATDDERIASAVTAFGGEAVMTSEDHPSGTDRVHEASQRLGLAADEVVVNVQGDEPLMPPDAINHVAALVGKAQMATLCERIDKAAELFDPNVVKVVCDAHGMARYFSRAPIPWHRDAFASSSNPTDPLPEDGDWHRHLGIYAYTSRLLAHIVAWPVGMAERTERLEQLRVLDNGVDIRVAQTPVPIPPGVDAPEDVERVLAHLDSCTES